MILAIVIDGYFVEGMQKLSKTEILERKCNQSKCNELNLDLSHELPHNDKSDENGNRKRTNEHQGILLLKIKKKENVLKSGKSLHRCKIPQQNY